MKNLRISCLLATATTALLACGDRAELAGTVSTVRDALAADGAWTTTLPPHERAALREQIDELALRQADSTELATLAGNWTSTTRLVRDIDAFRRAAGQPPLVHARIELGEALGALAACPPPATSTDDNRWEAWLIDDAFPDVTGGAGEFQLLRGALPAILAAMKTCLPDDQADLAAFEWRVVRTAHAPFAFAFDPDERIVHVNPAWLRLRDASPATATPRVYLPDPAVSRRALVTATRGQPLDVRGKPLDECNRIVLDYCGLCDTEDKVELAGEACNDGVFPSGTTWENCQALKFEVNRGFLRYCVNDNIFAFSSRLITCMDTKGVRGKCGIGSSQSTLVAGTPEELALLYGGFIESATASECISKFEQCLEEVQRPVDPGNGDNNDGGSPGDDLSCGESDGCLSLERCCGTDDACNSIE